MTDDTRIRELMLVNSSLCSASAIPNVRGDAFCAGEMRRQ
jgi:hypothetical protein